MSTSILLAPNSIVCGGFSSGVFPANDHDLVTGVLSALDVPEDFPIGDRTFREALTDGVSLSPDPEAFIEALSILCSPASIRSPRRIVAIRDASRSRSMRSLRDRRGAGAGLGVCSTFLGGRVAPGDEVISARAALGEPEDPAKPIIMIGPGTGIAPFRAFLHERQAIKAPGRNWLFFGHQRSDYDYFYEDELVAMRAAGLLTRLTLAWSRDGKEKTYVQRRMREVARDLWSWISGRRPHLCVR